MWGIPVVFSSLTGESVCDVCDGDDGGDVSEISSRWFFSLGSPALCCLCLSVALCPTWSCEDGEYWMCGYKGTQKVTQKLSCDNIVDI